MSDEQKLEVLHKILQSANVKQVNLCDGSMTINIGKSDDCQKTTIPYAELVDAEAESQFEDNDALIRYIFSDEDRAKVIKGLRTCTDTGQVAAFAKVIYTEEILSLEVLRSKGFHQAIKPLLRFKTSETAIKQAILKQVN